MIQNCDCIDGLRSLAAGSVDALITDPPYGMDYQCTHRPDASKRHAKIAGDKQPFVWFLADAFRVVKDKGCLLCFCSWHHAEAFRQAITWAGFKVRGQLVWDRVGHGMGDLQTTPGPQHDLIWFAAKGRFTWPAKRLTSVLRVPRVAGDSLRHPNEKPVELMRRLVEATTLPGQLVCDPMAGSGSTGAACHDRNFIGFELDPEFCAIARQREQLPQ
jgi:DNA modification methylase